MTQTPPYQVTDPATGEVVETSPSPPTRRCGGARRRDRGVRGMAQAPGRRAAAIVKRMGELFAERAAEGRADHQGDGQAARPGRR